MQKIHLDISEKTLSQVVYAKQFDVGRKFIVALYDNGVPYTIPESATLSVGYAAADGKNAGNFGGAVASENTIEITIDEIMTSTAGDGVLSVTLLHENGDEISTWNVPYSIEMQPGSFPVAPSPNTVNLTKAVLFSAQNLTDAQKAQARKNIGVTATGGSTDGVLSLDGGTMNGEIVIGQGSGKGIQLGRDGKINATAADGDTTATVFGISDRTDVVAGHEKFNLAMRGKLPRPLYNESPVALLSDVSEGGGGSEDGFSPIATVTQTANGAKISITDKNGTTSAEISDGKDGNDGTDGVSVTHKWIGTTLQITSASGTSSVDLKGPKGDPGSGGGGGDSVWTESTDHHGCYYRIISSTGADNGQVEWLNPPMIADVPYRTAERFGNDPVYKLQVDLLGHSEIVEDNQGMGIGYAGNIQLSWSDGEFGDRTYYALSVFDYSMCCWSVSYPSGDWPVTPDVYNDLFSGEGWSFSIDDYGVSWRVHDVYGLESLLLTIKFTMGLY